MIHRPGEFRDFPAGQPSDGDGHATPHPVRFDRILSWESGQQAVALKHVSLLAPFFKDHFPRKPVFPLSLLLEGLLQLGQRLLGESTRGPDAPQLRPVRICNVKMSRFVEPGSSVLAKVRVTERIRWDCVYMVHGFGHSEKGLSRAFGKGASDAELITRTQDDPIMGGTGMRGNFVTFQLEKPEKEVES